MHRRLYQTNRSRNWQLLTTLLKSEFLNFVCYLIIPVTLFSDDRIVMPSLFSAQMAHSKNMANKIGTITEDNFLNVISTAQPKSSLISSSLETVENIEVTVIFVVSFSSDSQMLTSVINVATTAGATSLIITLD